MFVDETRVEMVPSDQWPTLGLDGLYTVKNQLLDKIFMARGNPAYTKPLSHALAYCDTLISVKVNGAS